MYIINICDAVSARGIVVVRCEAGSSSRGLPGYYSQVRRFQSVALPPRKQLNRAAVETDIAALNAAFVRSLYSDVCTPLLSSTFFLSDHG